ncbi:hypothetical protein GCM10007377_15710 [Galliscardovia ingluviei]|uniref:Uncharacterized protein n=1 Tax=Galliscardovia ingluviei TaxID=1769422 RepID=A0A8J3AK92_9BIFI|nr:hypothetical protein GCM10007377_15710 [Galliscardovia ingluviei]
MQQTCDICLQTLNITQTPLLAYYKKTMRNGKTAVSCKKICPQCATSHTTGDNPDYINPACSQCGTPFDKHVFATSLWDSSKEWQPDNGFFHIIFTRNAQWRINSMKNVTCNKCATRQQ